MNDLTQQAVEAINSGDQVNGRQLLSLALRTDPGNELAWLWLATVVDDAEQRRECVERVLAINPNNETAWLWMATVVDEPAVKRDCYERVLAIDPSNGVAQEQILRLAQESAPPTCHAHAKSPDGAPAPESTEPGADSAGGAGSGWVYVLINASMPGLVRVGKTSRDPEEQARALSATIGAPTPFLVAYQARFADCAQGEATVHAALEQQGRRVRGYRELFNAPPYWAVDTVVQAARIYGQSAGGDQAAPQSTDSDADQIAAGPPAEQELWWSTYQQAEACYHGTDGTARDRGKALCLFQQAADLGCPWAHWYIGTMYREGAGCRKNPRGARDAFREGAKMGDGRCWAELGRFLAAYHEEISARCWGRYFESGHFRGSQAVGRLPSRAVYAYDYLVHALDKGHPIVFRDRLIPLRQEILGVSNQARAILKDERREYANLRDELQPETREVWSSSIKQRRAQVKKARAQIKKALAA